MPLPLCYLLMESLCQICCIAVSIKYKQNSGRFENIWPYQNSMYTNFSIKLIEESPREWMTRTSLQVTLTTGNGKIHDQFAYSVNLIRWRITLQYVHAEFCQSGSLAFHKYDFQAFLQGALSGFQQFLFSYSQSWLK